MPPFEPVSWRGSWEEPRTQQRPFSGGRRVWGPGGGLTPAALVAVAAFSLARCTSDSRHSSGGPCPSSLSRLRFSSCSFSDEASFSLRRQG